MIKSVSVINHLGESITMELRSPEQSGFFIAGIDGLGPTKSIINTTEVLSYDGSFFNSSKNTSRNIVISLGFMNHGDMSIETIRQLSYRVFPMNRLLRIEIVTDNRSVFTMGYVESNEPDIFSKSQQLTQISILCPSAFFQDTTSVVTPFAGSNPGFEFPFENPSLTTREIEFGELYTVSSKSIQYTGDTKDGVVLYASFIGPSSGVSFQNESLGQTMGFDSAKIISLTGSDFVSGDVIVISTYKGSKYAYLIRSEEVINILNALSPYSDWFTIERGDNIFSYSAITGSANIQMSIENRTLYGGI